MLSDRQLVLALLVASSALVVGCTAPTGQEDPIGVVDPEVLPAGVRPLAAIAEGVTIEQNGTGMTIKIDTTIHLADATWHQFAFRAPTEMDVQVRSSAALRGWGGPMGCAILGGHAPAPAAKQLITAVPGQPYPDLPSLQYLQATGAWGGGGAFPSRIAVAGQELVYERGQLPALPLVAETIILGDRRDEPGRSFRMEADSWLMLGAGGQGREDPGHQLEWSIAIHAEGPLDAYAIAPAPLMCGVSATYDGNAQTQASLGQYGVLSDASFSMTTQNGSFLYFEHLTRQAHNPQTWGVHEGDFKFLEQTGPIAKDSLPNSRSFVNCNHPDSGDLAIQFNQMAGSGSIVWLMADTPYLPMGPGKCRNSA